MEIKSDLENILHLLEDLSPTSQVLTAREALQETLKKLEPKVEVVEVEKPKKRGKK